MPKLRKQIKESFFNPILHFIPTFLFLILHHSIDLFLSWTVSVLMGGLLSLYVYKRYRGVFQWFVASMGVTFFLLVVITATSFTQIPSKIMVVAGEYWCLIFLAGTLILRKRIEKTVVAVRTIKVSMHNNLDELYRVILLLTIILFVYVHLYLVSVYVPSLNFFEGKLFYIYILSIVGFCLYEVLRVRFIRRQLLQEEWWPILNEQGRTVGSIQNKLSLEGPHKYTHPVVRMMLIDNNKILLHKNPHESSCDSDLWDTFFFNHVRVNETVEQCIERTCKSLMINVDVKPVFLSNHIHETTQEFQYTFLFILCRIPDTISFQNKSINKWWTVQQIDENLSMGIFTESFITEINILKRSGMLDAEKFECKCRLKDTLYEHLNTKNKEYE